MMKFSNLVVKNVEKNKRSCICILNRTDPARNWQLYSEHEFTRHSMSEKDGVFLGEDTSSGAITGSADVGDDPQTALELLGI